MCRRRKGSERHLRPPNRKRRISKDTILFWRATFAASATRTDWKPASGWCTGVTTTPSCAQIARTTPCTTGPGIQTGRSRDLTSCTIAGIFDTIRIPAPYPIPMPIPRPTPNPRPKPKPTATATAGYLKTRFGFA